MGGGAVPEQGALALPNPTPRPEATPRRVPAAQAGAAAAAPHPSPAAAAADADAAAARRCRQWWWCVYAVSFLTMPAKCLPCTAQHQQATAQHAFENSVSGGGNNRKPAARFSASVQRILTPQIDSSPPAAKGRHCRQLTPLHPTGGTGTPCSGPRPPLSAPVASLRGPLPCKLTCQPHPQHHPPHPPRAPT